MSGDNFLDLIARVRRGEQEAAAELMERYGPHVRRIARRHLDGNRLQRLVESVDICQSVMANFFHRASEGQFEIEQPDNLLRLLGTMVRNHILKKAAFHQAQRRDLRRQGLAEAAEEMAAPGDTPSIVVSERELRERVRNQLSEQERQLFDERVAGRSWNEIAEELAMPVDRLRKRLTRALERAADEIDPGARQPEQE